MVEDSVVVCLIVELSGGLVVDVMANVTGDVIVDEIVRSVSWTFGIMAEFKIVTLSKRVWRVEESIKFVLTLVLLIFVKMFISVPIAWWLDELV